MNQKIDLRNRRGFALPTVMIASVVMLLVLLSGLVSASSSNVAIRSQYEAKQIKLAAEAGVAMVNACLAKSYNVQTWTDAKKLRPNTDCDGDPIGGSAYVLDTTELKTTFEVPDMAFENGTQRANVTGRLLKFRSSGGASISDTSEVRSALIGTQTSFSNVALGSCSIGCADPADEGAQMAVVLATGVVKTLGKNNNGRLGNGGPLVDATSPSTFLLPAGERGVAAFTNFLSVGRQISVVTASGKMFSAGNNQFGQFGNGTTQTAVTTPVQFMLPTGKEAVYVGSSIDATYAMTKQGDIYAAGNCTYGQLGTGTGCAQSSTPLRVALPAYNAGDLNTQPVTSSDWVQSTNLGTDSFSVFVRMKGGHVYGWGLNSEGQLGDGTFASTPTPKRILAMTSSSTPIAKQVAFSGRALYILDTSGRVWATGANYLFGSQGGTGANMYNAGADQCMAKESGASNKLINQTCSSGNGMQWMEWWPDGTWRFRSNSGSITPAGADLCATAPNAIGVSAGNEITLSACVANQANQQWVLGADKTIRSPLRNACTVPFGSLFLMACDPANTYYQWTVAENPYLRPVPVPPGAPLATRISTDNSNLVIRYANGEVWSAGSNNRGQLGNGAVGSIYNPVLKKAIIPSPRTVVDIYNTENNPAAPSTGVNGGSSNNTFYVLDDGSVYGAGANNFGQLGNGGAFSNYIATPVKMSLTGVSAQSVQSVFGTTVIITTKGKVYSVGNNSNGQLGNGSTTSSSTPTLNQFANQRSTIIY